MRYQKIIMHSFSILAFFSLFGLYGTTAAQIQRQETPQMNFRPTVQSGSVNPAQSVSGIGQKSFAQFVADLVLRTSQYTIRLLVALSVFVFLFGIMKYMFKGQGSDTARTEGRALMLWGIIGLFAITAVWGLVSIAASTIGHSTTITPQFKR